MERPPRHRDVWGLHTGLLNRYGVAKPALSGYVAGASVHCSR